MHLCTYVTATVFMSCWRKVTYFQHLWTVSLQPVACEMRIFWLPLFTRERRRHSSKSRDGEETTAVGERMLVFFFICQGLCLFPGMAAVSHITSGVFLPEMYWKIRTAMITKLFCACCLFCDPPTSTAMSVCVRIFVFRTRVFSTYHISPVRA